MFGFSRDLFTELRELVEELGAGGGLISASVYDTAQVVRLCPPPEGVEPALKWLVGQRHPDGGWGEPTVPTARDIPTLAAILALHTYRHLFDVEEVIAAGLSFLRCQALQWKSIHIDLVPIAGEVIFPYLLEEAARLGLVIDQAPYARVFELRRIKLNYLEGHRIPPNSAPTYSWEALGFPFAAEVLHPETGVGHSPAATAAWLQSARLRCEDRELCAQAEAYLARAAETTDTGIPGVMPMVYPITGFELCYGLYALLLTGLLDHPKLQDVVAPQVARLAAMVEREKGLSFGENFVPDVDETAVAVAVLSAAGLAPDVSLVRNFWRKDHFYTYTHELNPSVFSNAHALHALVMCGQRCDLTENFLIRQQTPSGAWVVDKWHTSWRSSTLEVVAALLRLGYEEQLCAAGDAFIADQNADGSWGLKEGAPMLETAYSVIALQLLSSNARLAAQVEYALKRGQEWLDAHVGNLDQIERLWLGKEVYSAIRVDKVYKLCAMLSPSLHVTHPMAAQPVAAFAVAAGFDGNG